MPAVSVIIPVYNVQNYIARCIDSVLAQDFQDFEIILVDDGSTDNSGKICDEYSAKDSRIKVLHKINGGVSSARNYGIGIARGEYITFIDSDDYIRSDCLQTLIETILQTNSEVVCYEYISSLNNFFQSDLKVHVLTDWERSHMISEGTRISNSCVLKLCKRKTIEEKHIRFSTEQTMAEDSLFSVDCFNAYSKISHINYVGYVYEHSRSGNACSRYYPEIVSEIKISADNFYSRIGGTVCDGVIYHHIYNIFAEAVNLYYLKPESGLSLLEASHGIAQILGKEPFKSAVFNAEIYFKKDILLLFLLRKKMYTEYLLLKSLNARRTYSFLDEN